MGVENGCVHGDVIDEGSRFVQGVRGRGIDEVGGNGSGIVAAVAAQWGIHEGSTTSGSS